ARAPPRPRPPPPPARGGPRAPPPPPRDMLILSAQGGDGRWANAIVPIRPGDPRGLGWLIVQTVIIYLVILAAILWIGRRIARPVAALTRSAKSFGTGDAAEPVPVAGPADVRRLIEAHNQMRERVAAMLVEKDQMLGAIGHDLRTPLASLRIRAENALDEAESVKMAETIEEMNRILDDILALARLGRPGKPARRTDLAALADALVEDMAELGGTVRLADSPRVAAEVRPDLIRRALRNLIENAIKYGGGAEVGVRAESGEALIEVLDRGPGIPAERIAEMMEPFTRMEPSRSRMTGGAGLGLALARAIARDHGGELRLENRANGGLAATIVLPLV
ncbi:MAG: ATP-binding protein, partial [Sphingomonadaceae bacterium]